MDDEERKIAILYAAFEEINAGLKAAQARLEQSIHNVGPIAGQMVKLAMTEELRAVRSEVEQATAALGRLRRAADWRMALGGAALVIAAVAVTLAGFWVLTPGREEMNQLRAERQQLQAGVDALAARGGRADVKTCGAQNEHLCVRVAPALGRYGAERDYLVIKGY